jgi:hypothetical protein
VARGAARADSLLERLFTTRRLVRLVARDTTLLDTLAAWARDPALPLPLRDDCVRAIGLGWVDNEAELLGGVAAGRDTILARLADSLSPALQPALRGARSFTTPGWVQRLSFAAEYQDIVAPLVAP